MRERIRTVAALAAAAGVLVASCGGSAGDEVAARRADPTPTTLDPGADFTDRQTTETPPPPTTPSTTTRPPPTSTTEPAPPRVDAPLVSTTVAPDERALDTTTVPEDASSEAAGSPGAEPELFVPTWPPYTPRPGLTEVGALTGLPVSAAVAAGPIVVAKVDNVGQARPQWSLDRADVVFEENVEGATRFLALFHSDLPAELGPVRSARTTDIDLLPAMNRPALAWSGGNPGVTKWVAAAVDAGLVVDVGSARNPCYRRDSSRRAPHNLVATTGCVVDRGTAGGAGAAVPLWAIDTTWTPGGLTTTADTTFTVAMDGGLRAGWAWDPASALYVRSQNGAPHVTAEGAVVSASNVVVLNVVHRPSIIDARSPHAETIGSGTGVVHRDGRSVPVTWSRPTIYDPFQFTATDGSRVPLQVGRTFVELAR